MKLPPKGADRDAFLARVAADYTAGRTLAQLAVEHGVSQSAVAAWLDFADCPRRPKCGRRGARAHNRERALRAVELYRQHPDSVEVAARVGASPNAVLGWVRNAGVAVSPRGRPTKGDTAGRRTHRDRALDLHAQGVAHKMIASNLGRHVATVNRWCTEADRERVVRIREVFAQGMERADIAALFNTSVAFVTLVTAPAWRAA